jgi:hypothetical protein
VLTDDEARWITSNIAKLTALIGVAANPEFDFPELRRP